jgi:hypothetical protein
MRRSIAVFAVAVWLLAFATVATAQEKAAMSDAQYTAQSLSAAPRAVAKDAAVVRMDADGKMRTLRAGKNGFTCMMMATDKMCNDPNSMEFFGAMMNHQTPTDKTGISYMLAGDDGASNTDPSAMKKTADNHWVVTGPHIMLTGAASKSLGYTEAADPDPSKPYMMWAGTPYEHAMIPIGAAKPVGARKPAAAAKP